MTGRPASEITVAVIGAGRDAVLEALRGSPELTAAGMSDIEAAGRLRDGEISYIIGVCESGGGAALAIPIAVLGLDTCINLSKLGKPVDPAELPRLLAEGRRAFGVARDHVVQVVPALADAIATRSTGSHG